MFTEVQAITQDGSMYIVHYSNGITRPISKREYEGHQWTFANARVGAVHADMDGDVCVVVHYTNRRNMTVMDSTGRLRNIYWCEFIKGNFSMNYKSTEPVTKNPAPHFAEIYADI